MAEHAGSLDQLSDQELVALCVQRPVNQEAWEQFYERFHTFVENQIRRKLGGSIADLADITQDTFFRIFRILPSYDPAKSQLKTYLSHVITNLAIDYFRRKIPVTSRDLDAELDSLQIQAAQNPEILRATAERIVKKLPDRDRVELMLDLLYGKDVKEICAERHLTGSYVYGARGWLREQLREISAALPKY
jgi:RNA polymerase sigma factor (sigma-70 family)